jgi:cathepsin L
MTKCLYVFAASVILLGARPASADNGGTTPQGLVKTYKVTGQRQIHAKGFSRHETGRARRYRKAGSMQSAGAVPGTFDLRPTLTQIENQGNCGSCWAFSLTATNRDGHALDGSDPGRLSQQWLIDNSTQAQGCNGGDFDSADELVAPGGSPLWDECPYRMSDDPPKCAANMVTAASITGWSMLGDANAGPSALDIETYMAAAGKPVSIAVAAAAGDWEGYAGGIYNGCTAGALDHMINIVGWDNEGTSFDGNGNLPPGKGVWILRNSWGTSWGEAGYMRTKMTDPAGKRCNNVAEQAASFDF